jgi:secondary thiamine-phosphate synthase enzyme
MPSKAAEHVPPPTACCLQSSLMGPSLSIPVGQGRLVLGTWQGIYLNEHRDYGGPRRIVITVQGQRRADGRSYRS